MREAPPIHSPSCSTLTTPKKQLLSLQVGDVCFSRPSTATFRSGVAKVNGVWRRDSPLREEEAFLRARFSRGLLPLLCSLWCLLACLLAYIHTLTYLHVTTCRYNTAVQCSIYTAFVHIVRRSESAQGWTIRYIIKALHYTYFANKRNRYNWVSMLLST